MGSDPKHTDIILLSLVSEPYFKIVQQSGLNNILSLFDDTKDVRAFKTIEQLWDRYSIHNLKNALVRCTDEDRATLYPYLAFAQESKDIMEEKALLDDLNPDVGGVERDRVRDEIHLRLKNAKDNALRTLNKHIMAQLENDPSADVNKLLRRRHDLINQSGDVSRLREWSDIYDSISTIREEEYFSTGIEPFDRHFKLYRGTIFCLAGAPGSGKTTMANQILLNSQINTTHSSIYFSLETTARQMANIFNKYLSNTYGLDQEGLDRFHAKSRIRFSSEVSDVNDMIAEIDRSVRSDPNLRFVFIDYVQLMRDRKVGQNSYDQISSIMTKITEHNMKWNLTIFMLSQLAKDQYGAGMKPTLSSLKGSGDIAQASAYVLANYPTGESVGDVRPVECRLLKCRYAGVTDFKLMFDGNERHFYQADFDE